jgi:hypothetical protein
MSTIFGSSSATFKTFATSSKGVGLSKSKSKIKSKSKEDQEIKEGKPEDINVRGSKSVDVLEAAKELVKKTQKKVVITETKKFAGQEIRY